jgi:hypothetical protein
MTVTGWIFLRMRNILDKFRELQNTHFIFCNVFFRKRYRKGGKYTRVGYATDDITLGCLSFVCWIPKATNTHSTYVILIAFPQQQDYANTPKGYFKYTLLSCYLFGIMQHIILYQINIIWLKLRTLVHFSSKTCKLNIF